MAHCFANQRAAVRIRQRRTPQLVTDRTVRLLMKKPREICRNRLRILAQSRKTGEGMMKEAGIPPPPLRKERVAIPHWFAIHRALVGISTALDYTLLKFMLGFSFFCRNFLNFISRWLLRDVQKLESIFSNLIALIAFKRTFSVLYCYQNYL